MHDRAEQSVYFYERRREEKIKAKKTVKKTQAPSIIRHQAKTRPHYNIRDERKRRGRRMNMEVREKFFVIILKLVTITFARVIHVK